MKILFDYNRTLFNPDAVALYPGVVDMLKNLSAKATLFLVSLGKPGRSDVFEQLGIASFFKKVAFVEEKTEEAFRDILGEPDTTFVVGDRLKGEIRIGNVLGYTTVWVKQGKFSEEIPSAQEKPAFTINDIRELEKIISTYEK
jgi:FMN phosphatase YigB (HAD superfamily)